MSFKTLGCTILWNLAWLSAFAGKDGNTVTAQKLLSRSLEYLKSAQALSIQFTAKSYWQAMDEWQTAEGKLWTGANNQFHLFLSESELVSDGKTFWQYSVDNNQVVIEDVEETGVRKTPGDVMLQFMNCEPARMVEVSADGKSLYRVELIPTARLNHYDSIFVYLDRESNIPTKVHTVDDGGNETIYGLTEIRRDVKFHKSDFVFNPPKGVEILDMRD